MKIEKLELKQLKGYLDCNVNILNTENGRIYPMVAYNYTNSIRNGISLSDVIECEYYTPCLLPLSSLTEPLEDGTVPIDEFFILYGGGVSDSAKKYWKKDFVDNILYSPIEAISFCVVEKLLEWHFDIFDLIGSNLAIDKRTVKL